MKAQCSRGGNCGKLFHTAGPATAKAQVPTANTGWWCHETVGGSRAQGSSTGQVSNAYKLAEVGGSSSMKHFVRQRGGYFELDALFDA